MLAAWASDLLRMLGGVVPDDYLVWDCETTGFARDWDLPVELGWVVVRGRRPLHRGSMLLDWTRHPEIVDPDWLRSRLDKIAASMAEHGKPWRITVELLAAEGKDPFEVLEFSHKLFQANREAGAWFVNHNSGYDAVVWPGYLKELLGVDWEWAGDTLDTGAIEKMIESQDSDRPLAPRPGETLAAMQRRVTGTVMRGIKWSLDRCVEKYRLPCEGQLHSAGTDAELTRLLLERHRRVLERTTHGS